MSTRIVPTSQHIVGLIVVLLLFTTGCEQTRRELTSGFDLRVPNNPASEIPTVTPLPPNVLNAQIDCSNFDHVCYLIVTLVARDADLETQIEVEVISGIYFELKDDHFMAVQTNQRRLRTIDLVTALVGETRQFRIPYKLAKDALYPGEYAIRVKALNPVDPEGEPLHTAQAKAFIGRNSSNQLVLLPSQGAFNSLYVTGQYAGGEIGVAYNIDLEEIVHPRRGTLFVRLINRTEDEMTPYISLTVAGGIVFRGHVHAEQLDEMTRTLTFTDKSLGQMYKNGSRVIIVKFDLDHDSPTGLYGIRTIVEGRPDRQEEQGPLGVEVKQAVENMRDRWLVRTQRDARPFTTPTPTPTATPTPVPTATLTPPAPDATVQPSGPTVPEPDFTPAAASATVMPAAVMPAAQEQTPLPTGAPTVAGVTPTVAPVQRGVSAESVSWTRQLTGFRGNLWRVYTILIEDQLPLSFVDFKAGMWQYNPQLAEDHGVLVPEKNYTLPEAPP